MVKAYGITTHCNFLVGLPGETEETLAMTLNMIEELLDQKILDVLEYRCVVPFPLAPMWHEQDKYGIKIKSMDWSKFRRESASI